jgi:steroid 5-alpha reductase family enzyme
MDPLLISAILIFGLNAAGFLYGYFRQSDKLTDLMYSLSFAVAAVAMFLIVDPGNRTAANMTLLVLIWAARLGGYLFIRIHRMEKDDRFDDMRPNAFRLAMFWVLQALTVWIVLLPLSLILKGGSIWLSGSPLILIGSIVWISGLLIETVADWQKFNFRNSSVNKGRFVNVGLWKISRHPNYLGEILVWIGFYLFALPALQGPAIWIGLLSPLWIIFLLVRVSGIPLLEKSADKRYGLQAGYQEYKRKTALLIPYIW